MWLCVDLALTDVSEERIVSIVRVEKSASGEPAWAGDCRLKPPVRNNQLYNNRERGIVFHMGIQQRGEGVCGEGQQQVAEGCV
jgi:hypothetical protein